MNLKIPQEVYGNISNLKEYVKTLGINPELIKDQDLFLCAFVHKSYASDFKEVYDHNERLEFV
jgi:dsRNA-specific ribonuclease